MVGCFGSISDSFRYFPKLSYILRCETDVRTKGKSNVYRTIRGCLGLLQHPRWSVSQNFEEKYQKTEFRCAKALTLLENELPCILAPIPVNFTKDFVSGFGIERS